MPPWSTRVLGWFSIGLGLAQLAAPGRVAALSGVSRGRNNHNHAMLLRAIGAREMAAGSGIVAQPRSQRWLFVRLAGDAMDLALLTAAMRSDRANRRRVALACACVGGITLTDALAARNVSRDDEQRTESREAITVNRSPAELYRFWRDVENLPRFMPGLEAVHATSATRSRWQAKGPAGKALVWDAEIVADTPDQFIAWRSLPDAPVQMDCSVRFGAAPGGRGTEVRLELRYDAPASTFASLVARFTGRGADQLVHANLSAFKQIVETGEVARSDATLRPGPRPARPDRELARA
jgi:uncharacterized membrane protein